MTNAVDSPRRAWSPAGFVPWLRERGLVELAFLIPALVAIWPLWAVRYPPIEDLPQHLAAIRVLHDYSDPELGFSRFFVTALGRTQYLAYYLTAHVLAFVFGVELANRLFVTAAVALLPYAVRALLRALRQNELVALFAFPLLWNAHLLLGFVNFIAAITLTFAGLALAVRERERRTRRGSVALALVLLATFYMHVVPFVFLALGVALAGFGDGFRRSAERWLVLAPSGLAAAIWAYTSPAGNAVRVASGLARSSEQVVPQFQRWSDALRDVPGWLTDILPGERDEQLLVLWGILALACLALGAGVSARPIDEGSELSARLRRRLGLLAPLAALAYFVTPTSYSWIWPINARFPLMGLLFLLIVLPMPRGVLGAGLGALVIACSLVMSIDMLAAFRHFQKDEVGELDRALAVIPKGQRVAGLIWDRGSRYVKFSPFIHAVAWYQEQKGGAVMFTFADFPQSPFRFRESNRPPRVEPRWEWMPERVDVLNDLGWYDYVLTRGGPGSIASQPQLFEPLFQGPHWSVFHRKGAR